MSVGPESSLLTYEERRELARARSALALRFISEHGEVTAAELAAELRLASAAGTLAQLLKAPQIKIREITARGSGNSFIKYYSLITFAGPWRDTVASGIQPFRLAEAWPAPPPAPFDEEAYLTKDLSL